MKRYLSLILLVPLGLSAQEPNPTQSAPPGESAAGSPLYRVNVVARTTKAVNYGVGGAPTKIDFQGTVFMPQGHGEAVVESDRGAVRVKAKFKDLLPPDRFGAQFLTYVLWAITPDGRPSNLGEIVTDSGNDGELSTATEFQTFALIVTAEPYYSVTQPSDVVVLENALRPDTVGQAQTVDAKYELLPRGVATLDISAARQSADRPAEKVSQKEYESISSLYQARNALQLAAAAGAADYAVEAYQRAEQKLQQAQAQYNADPKSANVVTLAREAAQTAEDARILAIRKKKDAEDSARAIRETGLKKRPE